MIIGSDKKLEVGSIYQSRDAQFAQTDKNGNYVEAMQPILVLREATCQEWLSDKPHYGNKCPASWEHYHYEVSTD